MDYWKKNGYKYPILSILARRYLAIPSTSATIERIFSLSSNIITKKRNRLSSTNIRTTILLKSWGIKDISNIQKEYQIELEEEEED